MIYIFLYYCSDEIKKRGKFSDFMVVYLIFQGTADINLLSNDVDIFKESCDSKATTILQNGLSSFANSSGLSFLFLLVTITIMLSQVKSDTNQIHSLNILLID